MLIRKSGDFQENTTGYILAFSKDFIVLQETNNFRIDGYLIIPVKTIKSIRRNKFEKTIQKIHHKEGSGKTGWILLDYFGLSVHILLNEKRNNYDLESLWSSAKEIVRIH